MNIKKLAGASVASALLILWTGCSGTRDTMSGNTNINPTESIPHDNEYSGQKRKVKPTKNTLGSRMNSLDEESISFGPATTINDTSKPNFNTESYDRIYENEFLAAKNNPLSTFSTDVDTASYSLVRRFLNRGQLPPPGAVRVEELINYFNYQYAPPSDGKPFAVHTELSRTPWNKKHLLLKIGIKGKEIPQAETGPRNLVFLLDVSGSMNSPDKLPLLKKALRMLSGQMNQNDQVSIVVYAGASGLVLKPTAGNAKNKIMNALEQLSAGGSTNGGQGIQLAYKVARQNFNKNGVNRVILATDGDFNVGMTNQSELVRLIEKQRESGIFLTVLGFGSSNYKDSTMEKLANKGNGNYAYIDNISEARKVLVQQIGGTLITIAKDVKLQIEFNPALVQSYRLIGYENRMLKAEDFNNDKKDAGEIGAGHTVTALYEIVPTGINSNVAGTIDNLRYQKPINLTEVAKSGELALVKIRYKKPQGFISKLLKYQVANQVLSTNKTSKDMKMASAVAAYGMLLRDSTHKGSATFAMVRDLAKTAVGKDPHGYRFEFIRLAQMARDMKQ